MKVLASTFALLSSSRLVGNDVLIAGMCYDSRKVEKGFLFIPLQGERTDGHRYIREAVEKGACAILLDEEHFRKAGRLPVPAIVARNVETALSRFASLYILGNRKFTSIGITGSCGKTTTKEMVASILSTRYNVASTPGNMNSTLGLPLALMEIDEDTDFAVYEMGVDHLGEMEKLTGILPPDLAVITNIGISHLEKFGSRENIAREKASILLPQTKGFVSAGIDFIDLIRRRSDRVVEVENPFSSVENLALDGLRLTLSSTVFILPLVGMHNVKDASLAVAIAREIGLRDDEIAQGLSSLKPLFGRSRVVRKGSLTVIEDCYNATLDSVEDAIDTISTLSWDHDKIIVLGDMRELGSESKRAHRLVGQKLASSKCDHILLYGEEMEEAYRVLYDAGDRERVLYTPEFPVLSESLGRQAERGDLVLIKASRSMQLERLYPTLEEVG